MPDIKPFQGVRYNSSKVSDISKVVAPPYDVISPEMQDSLYSASKFNIIRLILGKEGPLDNANTNKYTRARDYMNSWINEQILVADTKPCIYAYRQTYSFNGKKFKRLGFLVAARIEEAGKGVLPHEKTLAKPKIDRMNLIREVKANLSPIFGLYHEKTNRVTKLIKSYMSKIKPAEDIIFEDVRHEFWNISDVRIISKVQKALKGKKIVIADGHHRYEVSRSYRDMMRAKKDYNRSADYLLMYLTNLEDDKNLTIMATHRLIRSADVDIDAVASSLSKHFDCKKVSDLAGLLRLLEKNTRKQSYGICFGKKNFLFIAIKQRSDPAKLISGEQSAAWKRLDVAVLHSLIIKKLLSLNDSEDNIKYVRDASDVVDGVGSGKFAVGFIMNPTKPKQVQDVARLGDMMPQKSTYFYPKLLTGLVMNVFDKSQSR